jgi:hypothetical protein
MPLLNYSAYAPLPSESSSDGFLTPVLNKNGPRSCRPSLRDKFELSGRRVRRQPTHFKRQIVTRPASKSCLERCAENFKSQRTRPAVRGRNLVAANRKKEIALILFATESPPWSEECK